MTGDVLGSAANPSDVVSAADAKAEAKIVDATADMKANVEHSDPVSDEKSAELIRLMRRS